MLVKRESASAMVDHRRMGTVGQPVVVRVVILFERVDTSLTKAL